MKSVHLSIASSKRDKPNEDSFLAEDSLFLYAVADGVSSTQAPDGCYPLPSRGATAANAFCAGLKDYVSSLPTTQAPSIESLREAIRAANATLENINAALGPFDYISKDRACCVATVVWITRNQLLVAHLGDGAAFLVTPDKKTMTRCTVDQLAPIRQHLKRLNGEVGADYFPRIRFKYRNNPFAVAGNDRVGYGVFDGQSVAIDFVEYKTVERQAGCHLLLTTDGFARAPQKTLAAALAQALAGGPGNALEAFDGMVAKRNCLDSDDRTAVLVSL